MTYQNIILHYPYSPLGITAPHVAVIQLNRPKVLNALSTDLMKELVNCLNTCDDNPEIHTIVLTGNDKAFAAGADIAEMATSTPIDQIIEQRFKSWTLLGMISKPIIAAVNGFALGGGCELAMSCDLIVAGDTAKFGQPEIKIGTLPGAGGTQRLTRAIGKSKAMWMILSGEMMDAQSALESGLVAKVFPAETLLAEAVEMAKIIATKAPVAIRLAKEAVNKAFETSLKDGMDFERRNFFLTFSSADQKEGMRAFLEKREAIYKGK